MIKLDDRSFRRVIQALRSTLKASTNKETLERVAEAGVSVIVGRTRNRKRDDVRKPFTRYSAGYAEQKGVARNAVDLTLTGKMLDAITGSARGSDTAVISIAGAQEKKARWHHFGTNRLPERPFFSIGLVKSERIVFDDLIRAAIDKETLKVGAALR